MSDEGGRLDSLTARLRQLHAALADAEAGGGGASTASADAELVARELVEALRTDVRPHELPLAAAETLAAPHSILRVSLALCDALDAAACAIVSVHALVVLVFFSSPLIARSVASFKTPHNKHIDNTHSQNVVSRTLYSMQSA